MQTITFNDLLNQIRQEGKVSTDSYSDGNLLALMNRVYYAMIQQFDFDELLVSSTSTGLSAATPTLYLPSGFLKVKKILYTSASLTWELADRWKGKLRLPRIEGKPSWYFTKQPGYPGAYPLAQLTFGRAAVALTGDTMEILYFSTGITTDFDSSTKFYPVSARQQFILLCLQALQIYHGKKAEDIKITGEVIADAAIKNPEA